MEYDPVSFKTGIAIALLSKGRQFPKGEPVVPQNRLVSADGHVLQDVNGVYLIPKESE